MEFTFPSGHNNTTGFREYPETFLLTHGGRFGLRKMVYGRPSGARLFFVYCEGDFAC